MVSEIDDHPGANRQSLEGREGTLKGYVSG